MFEIIIIIIINQYFFVEMSRSDFIYFRPGLDVNSEYIIEMGTDGIFSLCNRSGHY